MLSTMIDVRIESGIEVATIKVLRQECRKSKIISAVSKPAVAASWTTPVIAARTKTLWSNRKSTLRLEGRPARILGINWRAPVHDLQSRGAAVTQDRQQGRVAPVAPDEVRLRIESVVDECDISDIRRHPIHVADRNVIQFIYNLRAAVERDIVLKLTYLRRAGRQDYVPSEDGTGNVLG